MTKSKTIMILESIAAGAVDIMAVMVALAFMPYGSSIGEIENMLNQALEDKFSIDSSLVKERRSLQQLICKLKRDGLVESSKGKFRITTKGKNKLAKRAKKLLPDKEYTRSSDAGLKIIAFDIPEKERRKRRWVREALTVLGFKMLQKSVWYGKGDIPEQFIKDLRSIDILEYVDILAVTKTGSVKQM